MQCGLGGVNAYYKYYDHMPIESTNASEECREKTELSERTCSFTLTNNNNGPCVNRWSLGMIARRSQGRAVLRSCALTTLLLHIADCRPIN